MVTASKTTGGAYFFEPLRAELNDTFTAMSNIAPDCVFSSRKGHEKNPNSVNDDVVEDADNPNTSDEGQKDKKKSNKCKNKYIYSYEQQFFLKSSTGNKYCNRYILIFLSSSAYCTTNEGGHGRDQK